MYDDILIPTDGSTPAEAAARYGLALAEMVDATVHVVSVVDARLYSEQLTDIDPHVREQRSALEDRAHDAVAAIGGMVDEGSPVTYTSAIEHGTPYDAILSHASENDIDLIVMGTHGRTNLDRFLLGSVTERVVRTSEIPVLAVPPIAIDQAEIDIESILVPTDGSPAANAAVDHGLSLATWCDAAVDVLYVIRTGTGLPSLGDPSRKEAEETVQAVKEQASGRDITVETHIQTGSPHDSIRTFITDRGIDLVTMGTHGRSGIKRYLLGSVTEKVLRTSVAPVLTVRSMNLE